MASVRFYIRSKNTNTSAIMGRLYFNGKEYIFSTKYSINPKNWNQKGQRVSTKERDCDNINSYLIEKASEILKVHDELKRTDKLTKENLIKRLQKSPEPVKSSLYAHIESTLNDIKDTEERKMLNGEQKRRYMHIRYNNTFERLKEFGDTCYKRELEFDDIDLNFYTKYVGFLKQKGLAVNSSSGDIKRLKRFLKLATIQKLNTNLIYQSSEFKAPEDKKKHVYLDEDEINILYNKELSGQMEKVRDVFIIGCRTGLRVSDYSKCVGDTVKKSGLICIDETDKTGEPVYIPMHWQVKDILEKYNGEPPVMDDIILNKEIKKLCMLAGFDKKTVDTRQGRNKPEGAGRYCPKFALITTHTARRSCATNLYMAGFDLYFIQGVLGHKKIETTIQYLGATRERIALRLVNDPYFKKCTGSVTEKYPLR